MTIELTREEIREVQAALPKFRRADPVAAAIVRRLVRAARPAKQPYASVSEAARVFGVTDQTIRNWVDRGWIASEPRIGRGPRRISRSLVERAAAFAEPPEGVPLLDDDQLQARLEHRRRRSAGG